jgi:FkbM family methyltransferase
MQAVKRTLGFIFDHPLGKRHPFVALYKLIKWQLQSRFSPSKFIIKAFVSPVKFYARKGLTGITGNIYTGLHEFNDMAFLLHLLNKTDIFFDVGANVGSYTLLASGVCKAKTIAIEPSANTAALLNKNLLLNQLQTRVVLVNALAGVGESTLTFSKNQDTTNHVIAENELQNFDFELVNVIDIDSLTINNKPTLIKIDVEGFETEVLKGMTATFKQQNLKAIIIELNGSGLRYGFDDQPIHQLLISNGFKPYYYDPFSRNLEEISSYGNHNTIYCRDIEFINNRLQTAAAFKVMGETI